MDISSWLNIVSKWYRSRKDDQVNSLERILYQAPQTIFGPTFNDEQSKALACWLDMNLRAFQDIRETEQDKAYQILQYTVAKLEQSATSHSTDILIKDWCLRRIQHLTVLSISFCQQQEDQRKWRSQAHQLINGHVKLMESLNWNEIQKHDQG
ncbi:transcriptional regulator [Vibrio azureus]|uniref:Transcriptional regulator n=1 Tax=Vibrio azureus NBRC 104587 TaxID=1219077 RepID=U3BYY9_9VIBR|nr:hypothetical protein [Vibrio azureus]AUI87541.1 transcriptional regulator [Vibrio azureus]GAD74509.1 hypothetical protein VAZ01S_011_00370 [Vibrio azureus NBRC 104587]